MTFLLLVTQSPDNRPLHAYILDLIASIYQQGHNLRSVFFTAKAASLATGDENSELSSAYLGLAQANHFPLLCCGRAYRDLGFTPDSLRKGFELSGNLELTVMMQECDKTVEF